MMEGMGTLDGPDQGFETPARSQLNSVFLETPAAARIEEEEDDVSAETPMRRNPGRPAEFGVNFTK